MDERLDRTEEQEGDLVEIRLIDLHLYNCCLKLPSNIYTSTLSSLPLRLATTRSVHTIRTTHMPILLLKRILGQLGLDIRA